MKWNKKQSPDELDDFTVSYEDDFGEPVEGEVYYDPSEDLPPVYHEPAYRNSQSSYNDHADEDYEDDYGSEAGPDGGYADEDIEEAEDTDYMELPRKKRKQPYEQPEDRYDPPKKKKKHGCLLRLIFRLIALLLAAVVGFTAFLLIRLQPSDFPDDSALGVNSSVSDVRVRNIALFGVDARDYSTSSRSDAIMILSVDGKNGGIKLSTLMRDTLVSVPGYGDMKLTESYAYGGPELAVRTINENFGLDITDYATVTFQAMADIIDAAGGVTVEITEAERVSANGSVWEQWYSCGMDADYIAEAGNQLLSGTQAVAYARIRHVGNADYQRTSRQRTVLTALLKQMVTHPNRLPATLMTAEDVVDSALGGTDILSMLPLLLRGVSVETARFPLNADIISDSYYVGSSACIYADMDATRSALYNFIYNDINPTTDSDRRSNGEE